MQLKLHVVLSRTPIFPFEAWLNILNFQIGSFGTQERSGYAHDNKIRPIVNTIFQDIQKAETSDYKCNFYPNSIIIQG